MDNNKNQNLFNLANTLGAMASSLSSYISLLGDDAVINHGLIATCDVQMDAIRAMCVLIQQALDEY